MTPEPHAYTPFEQALLQGAEWLAAHPANVDGADRTYVLRALRRMQRLFGRVQWPAHAELPPSPELLRKLGM